MQVNHEVREVSGKTVFIIHSIDPTVVNTQQFLDLIFNLDSDYIVVKKEIFDESFFDLKTGLAGDILQKVSTYSRRLGIVGDFTKYDSKSLKDFIFESNKSNKIVFVKTVEQAISKLMN